MITAFYHVGPVNHFREVVAEQLRILAAASFQGHTFIHYGGDIHEQGFIQRVADVNALPVTFLEGHPGREECPCLEAIHEYAQRCDPEENILYAHTKSITHPNWHTTMWRWMMNAYILDGWQEAEKTLIEGNWDFVAPKVSNDPFPHSSGNFWIAKASYVRGLQPFQDYYKTFMKVYASRLHGGWSQRHAAEAWIGSGPDVRALQLTAYPFDMWHHGPWVENIEAQTFATRHGS